MWGVIHFFTRFLKDVWKAGYFAILEYDVKLQETKTVQERILIWFAVLLLASLIILSLLYSFWNLLDSVEVPGI